MANENVVAKPEETVAKPEEKKDDLVTRVSQVKTEAKAAEGTFNINELDAEIEKVTDPNVKSQLLGLKKSLISGENQKYQEIAKLRKDYETKLSDHSTWTPEKIQTALNDPTFVKAAQDIMKIEPSEETSMLSETEKASLNKINAEQRLLRQQVHESNKLRQDEANKGKYANYDSGAVDIITANLLAGKVQATREDLWKVYDYEGAVKRAYELGKQDKNLDTGDKLQSTSIEGGTVTSTEAPLKQDEGESDSAYWKRLGEHNLKKFQSRQTKKE